jgi:electron transfer flavoprotein beta subunit
VRESEIKMTQPIHIVVFIKQVPDVPNIRIDEQRMTIIREGVESIINPLDCVALQAALELRESQGGHITAITMGPPQSEEVLREALAAGADKGILLTDPAFAGADTLATSHVLARAVSKLRPFPDLLLCGMQSIDSDTGHVGPQLAEELDLPQVCGVNEIHIDGKNLVLKRLSDGFVDIVRVSLPALLTVNKDLCPVKDLSLGDIEVAFSQREIFRWTSSDLNLQRDEVGLRGSATRVRKLRSPATRTGGRIVTGSPQFIVGTLIKKLESMSILDEEDGN